MDRNAYFKCEMMSEVQKVSLFFSLIMVEWLKDTEKSKLKIVNPWVNLKIRITLYELENKKNQNLSYLEDIKSWNAHVVSTFLI